MRYELHHESPDLRKVSTFVGPDSFFTSILNPGDTVILLAGAEVYDKKHQRLFHTTGCQDRLNSMCIILREKQNSIQFETWIVSSDYKIYDEFPDLKSSFGEEFFRDHYGRMEVFDLQKYVDVHYVITNRHLIRNGVDLEFPTP